MRVPFMDKNITSETKKRDIKRNCLTIKYLYDRTKYFSSFKMLNKVAFMYKLNKECSKSEF